MDARELCSELGVSPKKLARWRREGLPASKGKQGRLEFDAEAVAAWLLASEKAVDAEAEEKKKQAGERERDRDARRKRAASQNPREVEVPKCADRRRRTRLERDDVAWLRHYFGADSHNASPFWYQFTSQQLEMIKAIGDALRFGGDQALAASRGEGKTKIFERLLLKYTLQGMCSFSVLLAATGSAAGDSLDAIKRAAGRAVRHLQEPAAGGRLSRGVRSGAGVARHA